MNNLITQNTNKIGYLKFGPVINDVAFRWIQKFVAVRAKIFKNVTDGTINSFPPKM